MTEFEPSFPVKTVTDQDEKDVKENTVEHLGGNWTYTVEQSIPSNMPSNFYYDNFSFEDQIESCMKIKFHSSRSRKCRGESHRCNFYV